MLDEFIAETFDVEHKICPLTGEKAESWLCERSDCSGVSRDNFTVVHGVECYCAEDRRRANIERNVYKEREYKRNLEREKMLSSLQSARQMDYKELDDYCRGLNRTLMADVHRYDKDLSIKPYIAEGEHKVMYLIKEGTVEGISVTDNVFGILYKWKAKLAEPDGGYSFSMHDIPADIADVVQVNLYLRHGLDVSRVLKYDNPVYVNKKSLGRYIETVYGWKWPTFKKARAMHLEMTEIVNGETLIFIKQEIDEIVRRQTMLEDR